MIRFGLCCIFRHHPIRFRQTTAKNLQKFGRTQQLARLSEICLANTKSVRDSLEFVVANGIGAFRILSPLFPRYTHPAVGYSIAQLPDAEEILAGLDDIVAFRQEKELRLSFHPDQFNVMSSPHPKVVDNTVRELEYQGMVAEMTGAEIINIHVGGRYGNKNEALGRLKNNFSRLSQRVRDRLTLENDDVSFSPADLLPICSELGIPFVYDVHHHRCLPDELSVEEATTRTVALWHKMGREPYFHISSPKNGWQSGAPKPHADYIDPHDFPPCWLKLAATIDVEAKDKELAVFRLKQDLGL